MRHLIQRRLRHVVGHAVWKSDFRMRGTYDNDPATLSLFDHHIRARLEVRKAPHIDTSIVLRKPAIFAVVNGSRSL